ncbi:MAG: hypothetical protein IJ047_01580 [Paludibacteraceae bacterium]|nr:hypothetical protein [Paludibacteraceae bacterium]
MKRLNYLLALILLMGSLTLHAETISEQVVDNSRLVNPYEGNFSFEAFAPVDIQLPSFSLAADSGSLLHGVDIQVSILPYKSGMRMHSNMENVCLLSDGVRLLPNGEHFSKDTPALITLAYDPARIPMGYAPKDIYTYYSDDNTNWYRLERVAVDTVAHTILSYTNHFTDFANAVIKIPEMPESKAYVPTTMTDLPDVNPMQGIPMVEAPTANNRGTAELTYPIELPKGRHGMQPNVDLHYSSAGGNGILGVGWSLSTPAIAIDTRWGVPRYEPIYETEQYLVNGAPILFRDQDGLALSLPYQNNQFQKRKQGSTRFYARDTKNQDRIIRYGSNPTDYYWAVTDRNGITTYYGRIFDPENPTENSIDEQSVVRTDRNCIAYWAATATVDIFGNYILYQNEKIGNNIYVRQIGYTGNYQQGLPPLFRVCMNYKEHRKDISTNGRLGVLQTENRLLCNIVVQYLDPRLQKGEADNLAAYYMHYNTPNEQSLYKSRLEDVVMLDSVHDICEEIRSCDFDYQVLKEGVPSNWRNSLSQIMLKEAEREAARTHDKSQLDILQKLLDRPYGEYGIPANVTSFKYADAPQAKDLFQMERTLNNSGNQSLSQSQSTSWNVGGSLVVGPGNDVTTSILSGGANYDFSRSNGGCKAMLMDINGDGLADIVYEDESGGKVWYKAQNKNGTTFANPREIEGLTRLAHEVSNTHTWGLQLSFGANLSYSNPISTTYTDTYFTDINADGLPDMIDGDKILINHLNDYGDPSFEDISEVNPEYIRVNNSTCEKRITFDGEVDYRIECELRDTLVHSYSLEEFFGTPVVYEQGTQIIEDHEFTYPDMRYSDSSIYEPVEHILKSKEETYSQQSSEVSIKHDFPKIEESLTCRIEGNRVNIYKLNCVCKPTKIDPDIETVRVWVAPKSDTISIKDTIALLPDTSKSRQLSHTADGVLYTIQHCSLVEGQADSLHLHAGDYTILRQGSISAKDYNPHIFASSIYVREGDIILFRLRSGDNNRFDKTHWRHIITYDKSQVYDSERDYLCTGESHFQAYNNGKIKLSFSGHYDGSTSVNLLVTKNEETLYYEPIAQGAIDIQIEDTVQTNDSILIRLIYSGEEPRWSDIHLIPELRYISNFPISNTGIQIAHDTIVYYPDVQIPRYSWLYPSTSPYRKLFGPLNKGWGQFAYQDVSNNDTIFLDSLVNTQLVSAEYVGENIDYLENYQPNIPSLATYQPNISSPSAIANEDELLAQAYDAFSATNTYNPVSKSHYWIPMRADSRTEQWIAYGNLGCIGRKIQSNAREITIQDNTEDIIEYDSPLPFKSDGSIKNKFVRKTSRSIQNSISYGAGMVGASATFGTYRNLADYMDMNGDGYPDFVGESGIQYSMPWGGIGELKTVPNYSNFSSKNFAYGESFSACPGKAEKNPGNNTRDGKFHLGTTKGVSGGFGTSSTKIQYMDVNADGLPDRLDVDNHKVNYNLGYSFSEPYPLYASISEGYNTNIGANAGASALSGFPFAQIGAVTDQNKSQISIAQVSISAGVSMSASLNNVNELLIDINGDGLPDKLMQTGNTSRVAFNQGNNVFGGYESLNGIGEVSQDKTANVAFNIGATAGIPLGVVRIDFGLQGSPYGASFTEGNVALTDINGDGLVDYVQKDGNTMRVHLNGAGRANLLTSVTNPTGQEIALTYGLSRPSVEHRNRQWELVVIEDKDSILPMDTGKIISSEISYGGAYYDNYERTDYGYDQVRINSNKEKVKIENYHNHSLLQNGELYEDIVGDDYGNTYIRHVHGSRYKAIRTDMEIDDTRVCDDANTLISQEGYWTDYYTTESSSTITTCYNIKYDQYHNIVEYCDSGDIADPNDDWRQEITYLNTTANNMISLPQTEIVHDGADNVLRSSSIDYNVFGKPAHIHQSAEPFQKEVITHILYDDYGNINAIIAPEDANKENSWSAFEYDPVTVSNIVAIYNPFRETTRTEYDYRWGLPTKTTDPAGNEIWYRYDYKGRLEKVIAPREITDGRDYTVKYTYNLIRHNLNHQTPYLYTHVYKDMFDSLFLQKEVSLFDARGRMLQKKHLTELQKTEIWVVDGAEEWDVFGRVLAREYPFIAKDSVENYEPINTRSAVVYTPQYDVLDRPLYQKNADGTDIQMRYAFTKDQKGVLRFSTETIDENRITTAVLKSPQGWTIQQIAGDSSSTFFEYSPIGELLRSTDVEGYATSYTYDRLGHTIERIHPDAGKTVWEYDGAGNMISLRTANLNATGNNIAYIYKFGRLQEIQYPHHPENDVHYQYDSAGRVSLREDGTGSETFLYDELGNTAQSMRRIVIPTEKQVYLFKMLYGYDSFGRMRSIIYPDGEVVHYNYTTGGLLKIVIGSKNGMQPNIYLANREYDEQGRKIFQQYGNGVYTQYDYDPNRQWLGTLQTRLSSGDALQNLQYSYDHAGNIMEIDQSASSPSGAKLGGPYANHYLYDKQYRLVRSYGKGDFQYSFNADYSPAGRLGYKSTAVPYPQTELFFGYDQQHMTHQSRTMFDPQVGTLEFFWDANGNLAQVIGCQQNTRRLHEWDEDNRLRLVLGDKYAGYYGYDGIGERVYKLTGTSSIGQINSGCAKANAFFDDAVLYPNPYVTITPKGYTKHYYAGTERLATVTGNGGLDMMGYPIDNITQREHDIIDAFEHQYKQNDPFYPYSKVIGSAVSTVNIKKQQQKELEYQCKPTLLEFLNIMLQQNILFGAISKYASVNGQEEEIYFYHGDHLGSASWITDIVGKPIQYIHYAPYGELIKNQQAAGYDERYKFTGKERDWETGYDYFVARYLWSLTGHWLSVDPLADKYPNISPYAYAAWNPVKYIDPDGRDIYQYDDETGDIKLYMKTDDNFDQFGKFKYNSETGEYELQTNMDGSIKTYTDHRGNNDKIAKGILRNGLNIKQKGSSFISDNNAGPTITDYYNFALILDEVTGVEISGYVLEAPGEKNRKIVQFEPYKENSYNRSVNRLMKFFPYSVLKHFHTHGHADSYIDATTPSEDYDIPFKNKITSLYPDIQLLILHNHGSPIRY